MGSATNSVRSWDPVSMGLEDPVFQSSDQATSSQETPGRASRKRSAPSEHFCEPTGGLNHSSPTRSVRCCHTTSPSSLLIEHEDLNTQLSSPPSSPLPRGLLWITQNVQQHSLTPPSRHNRDEEEEEYISDEDDFWAHEDRHAALRLDIEGMSYEELLALEDRIGNVNTGISSSEIHEFVKQVNYSGNQTEEERCTICLEAYDYRDTLGQLSCGHAYHFSCITKWIRENPSCPTCKRAPERCGDAA